ncbi:DUF6056 family protein [Anaerolinea thermophila]|uniref:Hypothetical membrane protein n=2 Tax=Anaerolinea TaxID=233189 RepID=E8N1T6_ANATU|nr:DUF6056 family protein [Anaerolinea thermophila]BAJ62691.1 hypothetical membrane protein [Anaerolinea thermophila UNI-1]
MDPQLSRRRGYDAPRAVQWLAVGTFIMALAFLGYLGTYARYWADDYCYGLVARQSGLWQGLLEWYTLSGNRFSAFALVALLEPLGLNGVRFLPAAVLLLWVISGYVFLQELLGLFRVNFSRRGVLLLALMLVFYSVFLAPDRLQTLYWRMGTLHYTLPLPLMALTGWTLLRASRQSALQGWRRHLYLLLGLWTFFIGGLSETTGALQVTFLVLLGLGVWYKSASITKSFWIGWLSALAGALLALGVMLLSPSNAWRQAQLPPPPSLWALVTFTLRYVVDFVVYSLRGMPIPLGVLALTVWGLTILQSGERIPYKKGLAGIGLSLAIGALFLLSSMAPSVYAGLQYPTGRALMPARFIFIFTFMTIAWMLAGMMRSSPSVPGIWRWLAIGALLLGALYPMRGVLNLQAEYQGLSLRAQRWDERYAHITQALAQGERTVTVKETDVVMGLEDWNAGGNWVSTCAERYYGLEHLEIVR